jgi:transcriptional regulator with XRE-family HTH domain
MNLIFDILQGLSKPLGVIFGRVVREYRMKKGFSQMDLAANAGIHLTALGNIERGRRNPSLMTVFLLANALGVPPQEIITKVYTEKPDLTMTHDPREAIPIKPGRPLGKTRGT